MFWFFQRKYSFCGEVLLKWRSKICNQYSVSISFRGRVKEGTIAKDKESFGSRKYFICSIFSSIQSLESRGTSANLRENENQPNYWEKHSIERNHFINWRYKVVGSCTKIICLIIISAITRAEHCLVAVAENRLYNQL